MKKWLITALIVALIAVYGVCATRSREGRGVTTTKTADGNTVIIGGARGRPSYRPYRNYSSATDAQKRQWEIDDRAHEELNKMKGEQDARRDQMAAERRARNAEKQTQDQGQKTTDSRLQTKDYEKRLDQLETRIEQLEQRIVLLENSAEKTDKK